MPMSQEAMENSIIIIASVMGFAWFGLVVWVIILQIGLRSLKRKMRENEENQDMLSKRGYQEYQGPPPQSSMFNGRPEFQRQTSAQTSMYNPEPFNSRNRSMPRGYSPPNQGYNNSGYDGRTGSNFGPPQSGAGGVRVLPGGAGYQQQQSQSPSGIQMKDVKKAGKFAGKFGKKFADESGLGDEAKNAAGEEVGSWFS